MDTTNNTILIIGGPNVGKTHFGGQLYGRLNARTERYKITSPPDDLTIFQEVLDNLNEGKSSGHTHVTAHQTLELEIEDNERSEEHTSELQSLMRISYAAYCLKKTKKKMHN